MALIDGDGWLTHPLFVRVDGHPLKVYSGQNTGANGLACHSIVGEEDDFLDGVPNRFLSDERVSGNPGRFTDYAAASCMFILRKRMPHVVMYPVTSSTWTSGGAEANCSTWAMEAEGGLYPVYGEALTEHQIQGAMVIAMAWEERFGRRLTGDLVREHRQIARAYGYAPTACASGRYSEYMRRLAAGERASEEIDMTKDEIEALIDSRIKLALAIDNNDDVRVAAFRKFLDVAINGGPGAFTDPAGKPLALIRDNALVAQVATLETQVAAVVAQVAALGEHDEMLNRGLETLDEALGALDKELKALKSEMLARVAALAAGAIPPGTRFTAEVTK